MARERSIVLRLRAEISDYQSKMAQASRSLSDFEREQAKMGGAATTTLGRMVQAAQINEREWGQVGRTMLGVGTAMAGIGVATLKTGIDYNSLRQTATQALTAVTGSTEMATAQMRALDSMGRDSWLMRPTLIRAQQQMTGFGIETRKVIPYMEALADAVAATGGSNQDFEELARLMGQIQSQGKITARELMQFGMRGIDAAQLIGDAMGKTAGQIRDDITAGTLDAGVALDALAEGMATKFEGASDLVRETFSGAMDNLSAAWRDFAATLATPLVDPEGGGALVDWVNHVADALGRLQRDFAELPSGVQTGILAFGGITTAATLAAGSFLTLAPRIIETQASFQTLKNQTDLVGAAARGTSRAFQFLGRVALVAGVIVALKQVGDWIENSITGLNKLDNSVENATRRMEAFTTSADLQNTVMGDILSLTRVGTEQYQDMAGALEALDSGTSRWLSRLGGSAYDLGPVQERFENIGIALAGLSEVDLPGAQEAFNALFEEVGGGQEKFDQLMNAMPEYAAYLDSVANSLGLTADESTRYALATGDASQLTGEARELVAEYAAEAQGASGAVDEFGNAIDGANGSVDEQIDKLWELTNAHMEFSNQALDARSAARDFEAAIDSASDAVEENGRTLDITTEKGRKNEAALDDIASAGWRLIEREREMGASNSELRGIMARTRDAFIDTAQQMGLTESQAKALADQMGLIPDNVHTDVTTSGTDAAYNALRRVYDQAVMMDGKVVRISVNTSTDRYSGLGMGYYGNYEGGWTGRKLPGLQAGGRVPGPRAGYDNIMWPLHSGGRVLGQPLEGGEFVVRSSQAVKYAPVLEAINDGRFGGGHVGAAAPSVVSARVDSRDIEAIVAGVLAGSTRIADGRIGAFERDLVRGRR